MDSLIRFDNGCCIELVCEGARFVGLGEVRIGDSILRSGQKPMGVEIRDPNGVLVTDYLLIDRDDQPEQLTLRFRLRKQEGGPMEFMLHTVRNRYNTADWTQGPVDLEDGSLELILKPIERRFGAILYRGFSYQYKYHAESLPIYKILDRGTWEIGGRAVGNEFWMRSGVVPSIVRFEDPEDVYCTEWYLPGIHQPNIFQFFPLQTALQGFTFTAHDDGILVTWPSEVAHVRSLFEKKQGDNALVHWHEHCGDLAPDFETSPVEVLWTPIEGTTSIQRANLYEEVRSCVWSELHRQVGMRQEYVKPYGVMEEWSTPDLERYRTRGVSKLCDAGVETVMIPSFFQNNMNVWGVSNMCCTVDLKVADSVGAEAFAGFCAEVLKRGAMVEMWGNTSLSSLTDILSHKNGPTDRIKFLPHEGSAMDQITRNGDPWVRNLSGAVEADHYTPVFMVMNLRNEAVRGFWHESWKEAHRRFGVDGIFVDSSFNLSSDKFHFLQNAEGDAGSATIDQTHLLGATRPKKEPKQAVLSQYHAYLRLLVEMQGYGYAICGEDLGVFGVSRTGPEVMVRHQSLPIWVETLCTYDPQALEAAKEDLDAVYFSGLAYRMMWNLYWNADNDELTFFNGGPRDDRDRPAEFHTTLLRAFGKANPLMVNRHIAEDGKWVRYETDGKTCYWAIEDAHVVLAGARLVEDLVEGTTSKGTALELLRHHVYVVS